MTVQTIRKRLAFISGISLFLVGIAAVWIVNVGNMLSNILGIVFTLLGTLFAILQWPPPHPQISSTVASSNKARQPSFYEQIEGITLEMDKQKGALIVYTKRKLRGSTINLCSGFWSNNLKTDLASNVIGRKRKRSTVFLATFPSLNAGNYTIHSDSQEFVTKVSILPGRVEEVDWR